MTDLYIPLTTVTEVKPHPNADRLDIAIIGGWQVCVRKGSMQAGEPVIYVGLDAIVPEDWAVDWGVKEYLSKGERVKAIKLRGEPSYGFAVPVDFALMDRLTGAGYHLGDNVADFFGITKYLPPLKVGKGHPGNQMSENPKFFRYTNIANLRHTPDLFDGIGVVVTEKIHGANSRVGVINGERVAGSHRVQRRDPDAVWNEVYQREFARKEQAWYDALPRWKKWTHSAFCWPIADFDQIRPDITYQDSVYWKPWDLDGVETMLDALGDLHDQVILYGELYGPSIQALGYGVPQGEVAYVAFDLMIDGKFLDYVQFESVCRVFGVPIAPRLHVGVLSFDKLRQMSEGPTTLNGGPHIREGLVIRPTFETTDPRVGRMVAKLVSDSYLTSGTDASEDLASDAVEAEQEAVLV